MPLKDRSHCEAFEREYQQRHRAVVSAGSDERDELRDETAARVLAAAVEGVVHAAAGHGESGSPFLKDELERLVRGHLRERGRAC